MSLALQPRPSVPSTLHQHVLRLAREQRLRRQHVLDLARADAVRERAEGAVGGGVRVAADDRHARQRRALLRADDVDDALAAIVHLELGDAEAIAVRVERVDLQARDRIGDAVRAIGRRHVVVADREVRRQAPDLAAGELEALERLRARHLVDQVAVDVEQRRAVVLAADDVLVPELVVEGARHGPVRNALRVLDSRSPTPRRDGCGGRRPCAADGRADALRSRKTERARRSAPVRLPRRGFSVRLTSRVSFSSGSVTVERRHQRGGQIRLMLGSISRLGERAHVPVRHRRPADERVRRVQQRPAQRVGAGLARGVERRNWPPSTRRASASANLTGIEDRLLQHADPAACETLDRRDGDRRVAAAQAGRARRRRC